MGSTQSTWDSSLESQVELTDFPTKPKWSKSSKPKTLSPSSPLAAMSSSSSRARRSPSSRDLSHLKVELKKLGAQEVQITKWWATGAGVSALKTVCSHITNMAVAPDGKSVDIKSFLGEKKLRSVTMMDGVLIKASPKQKDEFWLEGNDVEKVSRTCALIYHKAIPRNKDIRKFLDGIYVSQKTEILKDNELLGI